MAKDKEVPAASIDEGAAIVTNGMFEMVDRRAALSLLDASTAASFAAFQIEVTHRAKRP